MMYSSDRHHRHLDFQIRRRLNFPPQLWLQRSPRTKSHLHRSALRLAPSPMVVMPPSTGMALWKTLESPSSRRVAASPPGSPPQLQSCRAGLGAVFFIFVKPCLCDQQGWVWATFKGFLNRLWCGHRFWCCGCGLGVVCGRGFRRGALPVTARQAEQ